MTELHAAGWVAVLVGVGLLAAVAVAGLVSKVPRRAFAAAVVLVAGTASVPVITGVILATTGHAPRSLTHWLYGGAVVLVPLLANGMTLSWPRRRQAFALLITAGVAAGILWRLSETGA